MENAYKIGIVHVMLLGVLLPVFKKILQLDNYLWYFKAKSSCYCFLYIEEGNRDEESI